MIPDFLIPIISEPPGAPRIKYIHNILFLREIYGDKRTREVRWAKSVRCSIVRWLKRRGYYLKDFQWWHPSQSVPDFRPFGALNSTADKAANR